MAAVQRLGWSLAKGAESVPVSVAPSTQPRGVLARQLRPGRFELDVHGNGGRQVSRSRSRYFWIFPEGVRGNASTNCHFTGVLYGARRSLQ
jgi:hypothetical protein